MNCNTIRDLIDEAERPDRPALEVADHVAECRDCRAFADQRVVLRDLLLSTGRVSAPPNFELMLKARLAARVGRSRLSWLTPAFYLKLGTAAAMVIVAFVLVEQRATRRPPSPYSDQVAKAVVAPQSAMQTPVGEAVVDSAQQPAEDFRPLAVYAASSSRARPQQTAARPDTELELAGGPVLLIRSPEMEVGVPAISVGAQPIFYANSGEQFRVVPASY